MTPMSVLLALPLLFGVSGSLERAEQLPLNPQDEVRQTTANVSAYLMCSCLFVEKASEAACRSDQMSHDKGLVVKPDFAESLVRVADGRWTGVARFLAPDRGCRLD